jgi:hypothetical protein
VKECVRIVADAHIIFFNGSIVGGIKPWDTPLILKMHLSTRRITSLDVIRAMNSCFT